MLVVSGLVYVPMPPAVYADSKDAPLGNALDPKVVPTLSNLILVRLVQPLKVKLPMLVTLSGIVIMVSPVQPAKVKLPMLVRPLFRVTLVRLVQP